MVFHSADHETDKRNPKQIGGISYMQVPIKNIQIKEGRRSLDANHVKELTDSIRELGLLNPITVDRELFLIAGLHRLEAVRILGGK